jgi:hypothetical protein
MTEHNEDHFVLCRGTYCNTQGLYMDCLNFTFSCDVTPHGMAEVYRYCYHIQNIFLPLHAAFEPRTQQISHYVIHLHGS